MHLIVLSGPTASGKTRLAIQLAQHYNTVIVSADSRQFFREMSIGTAKPDSGEQAAARHYFIDSHSIETGYSVGQYEAEVLQLLQELFKKHEVVILTGGSGLYLKAVCEGLDAFPEVPENIRSGLETDLNTHGLAYLQESLKKADPDYYDEVDLNNPHRLIRALGVCRSSGQPFSSFRQKAAARRPFRPVYLQLQWPRAELYERINQRVELMMKNGLLEEARSLYPKRHLTALQTVGYQELFDYFEHKTSLEEAIALIKRNSRRYAKRQMTWFRRDGFWKLFQPFEWADIKTYIDQNIAHKLAWSKERNADSATYRLLRAGAPVARFDRTIHKEESFTQIHQAPTGPLSWMLWHQIHLLALDDETAYVHINKSTGPLPWPGQDWPSIPGWVQRQIPETGSTCRIPK